MAPKADQRSLWRYASVGIEFIAAFLLGVLAGIWLDYRRGGGILWTLVGAAAGFAAGMYRLMRIAQQYRRDQQRKDSP